MCDAPVWKSRVARALDATDHEAAVISILADSCQQSWVKRLVTPEPLDEICEAAVSGVRISGAVCRAILPYIAPAHPPGVRAIALLVTRVAVAQSLESSDLAFAACGDIYEDTVHSGDPILIAEYIRVVAACLTHKQAAYYEALRTTTILRCVANALQSVPGMVSAALVFIDAFWSLPIPTAHGAVHMFPILYGLTHSDHDDFVFGAFTALYHGAENNADLCWMCARGGFLQAAKTALSHASQNIRGAATNLILAISGGPAACAIVSVPGLLHECARVCSHADVTEVAINAVCFTFANLCDEGLGTILAVLNTPMVWETISRYGATRISPHGHAAAILLLMNCLKYTETHTRLRGAVDWLAPAMAIPNTCRWALIALSRLPPTFIRDEHRAAVEAASVSNKLAQALMERWKRIS